MNKINKNTKRDFILFSACLFLAFLVWIYYALSTERTFSIKVPVRLTNTPDEVDILSLQGDTITVKANITGWAYYFLDDDELACQINADNIVGNYFDVNMENILFKEDVFDIDTIIPDTLFFQLLSVSSKTVPIKLSDKLPIAKNVALLEPVTFLSDVALIKGEDSLLNNIDYIEAKVEHLESIDKSQKLLLPLLLPEQVRVKPENIEIDVKVDKTIVRDTVITLQYLSEDEHIFVPIPAKVKIKYSFPFILRDSIRPDFIISYHRKFDAKSGYRKVSVASSQFYNTVEYIDPPYVQFLKRK